MKPATRDAVANIVLSSPTGWSLWPWALVRSAGFPVSWILQLAGAEPARAADRMIAARARARDARRDLEGRLERLRCSSPKGEQKAIRKALREIKKNRVPAAAPQSPAAPEFLESMGDWRAAVSELARSEAEFARAFAGAWREDRGRLRKMARDPRFCEALAWQNHHSVGAVQDRLAHTPLAHDTSKSRQAERMIAAYLQRYCVKNDTIGFFGPVCWAPVSDRGEALVHTPGDTLLAGRTVFFEDWAITALCRELDKDPALRPWLCPRRLPVAGLHGDKAYLLMPAPMQLSALEAQVLAMCDGRRRARRIAAEIIAAPASGAATEAEVFAVLDGLCKRGLAVWRVETMMSLRAHELLGDLLAGIDDPSLRARALAPLERLEQARDAAASARGPDALMASLQHLDKTFGDITGKSATRSRGRMYAARTLVAMDSRRADEITIGPAILERLTPVLSILMHAARWFTSAVAQSYRAALSDIYRRLSSLMNTAEVPLLRLWLAAQPMFPIKRGAPVPERLAPIVAELEERWKQLIDLSTAPATAPTTESAGQPGRPGRRYISDELLPKARAVFAAAAPGWSLARHHGPDVMIAAADTGAVARGDFQLILGEFHCAMNTSISAWCLAQHPRIDDMYRLWESDFPHPCVLPGVPRDVFPVRLNRELATDKDYRLEWAPEIAGPPRARPLAAGDLVAVSEDGALRVRSRDGTFALDVIEFFAQPLSALCPHYFKLPGAGGHTPRVTVDDVVLLRESWRVPAAELDFCLSKTPDERFWRARAWRTARDMPRFCFFRTQAEVKPVYVDFDSPVLVELFAHLCRAAAASDPDGAVSLSEMLPHHGQAWLGDRDGDRFVSEVRLVAVDPAAPATTQP